MTGGGAQTGLLPTGWAIKIVSDVTDCVSQGSQDIGLMSNVSGLGNGDSLLCPAAALRHNCNVLGGAECLLNLKVSTQHLVMVVMLRCTELQLSVVIKTRL